MCFNAQSSNGCLVVRYRLYWLTTHAVDHVATGCGRSCKTLALIVTCQREKSQMVLIWNREQYNAFGESGMFIYLPHIVPLPETWHRTIFIRHRPPLKRRVGSYQRIIDRRGWFSTNWPGYEAWKLHILNGRLLHPISHFCEL